MRQYHYNIRSPRASTQLVKVNCFLWRNFISHSTLRGCRIDWSLVSLGTHSNQNFSIVDGSADVHILKFIPHTWLWSCAAFIFFRSIFEKFSNSPPR